MPWKNWTLKDHIVVELSAASLKGAESKIYNALRRGGFAHLPFAIATVNRFGDSTFAVGIQLGTPGLQYIYAILDAFTDAGFESEVTAFGTEARRTWEHKASQEQNLQHNLERFKHLFEDERQSRGNV